METNSLKGNTISFELTTEDCALLDQNKLLVKNKFTPEATNQPFKLVSKSIQKA